VSYRNGGAAIVESLAAHGVDVIFGIPGTHNLELYRHLRSAGIRAVTTRHEQGAGYAADGYHQVSGKPGVVITTSGPALFNVAAAAGTAWAESRAMLIIAPGLPTGTDGGDAGQLHETKDSSGAFDRIVAWSRRVRTADDAAAAVTDAFAFFAAGRPRPVHIEVPLDVLEQPWTGTPFVAARPAPATPDDDGVRDAATALSDADRPVIVAGGGARRAIGEIRRLAERLGAPVVTTTNGKGVLPEDHPLAIGAAIRLRCVQKHLAASDVVLVVGSELGDSELWGGSVDTPTVIRLDIDPGQLDKNRVGQLHLCGDAAATLARLLDRIAAPAPDPGAVRGAAERAAGLRELCHAEAVADGGRWQPVVDAVRRALPAGSSLVGDSSQVTYFGSAHFFGADKPGEFLYMAGFATLGYGLPAAIGAKLADPDRAVAVLLGDGALMFCVQEIVTAVEQRLPLPIVVVDNSGYAEIKDQQARRGIAPIGVDLVTPDLPALARACAAYGVQAAQAADVTELVRDALSADRPTLIRLAC
jgi:acetolactate synthase-1/2/3 large subunit